VLKLRRGRVASVTESGRRIVRLAVTLEDSGEQRDAIAYPALTGPVEAGDDVVVNVEARDLGLGSGGFDVVHCNLTRGLAGGGTSGAHVMKLNYTSMQHAVVAVEEGLDAAPRRAGMPVAVLALHGQLPGVAFALAHLRPGTRAGFVQTPGGALPGALSDTVADLLHRGLLAGHVTAGACHGGADEAITLEGALDAAVRRLEWDCAIVGPGPGILGSSSTLGHGGLAALSSAHAALALGCPVVLVPRMSSGDERERHRGLSHHTETVLSLLLRPVRVAAPAGVSLPSGAGLERALGHGARHEGVHVDVSGLVEPYLSSGLPARTMGRSLDEDRDFFLAALGGGVVLADMTAENGEP
jgi:hypothetical protein